MKRLVISYYDSGTWWSVAINGKIHHKIYDDLDGKPSKRAYKIIDDFECNWKDFVKTYKKKFDQIIICENGGILIYE